MTATITTSARTFWTVRKSKARPRDRPLSLSRSLLEFGFGSQFVVVLRARTRVVHFEGSRRVRWTVLFQGFVHAQFRDNIRMGSSSDFSISSVSSWETVRCGIHGISALKEGSRLPAYSIRVVTAHAGPHFERSSNGSSGLSSHQRGFAGQVRRSLRVQKLPRCCSHQMAPRSSARMELADRFSLRLLLVAFTSGYVPAFCQ